MVIHICLTCEGSIRYHGSAPEYLKQSINLSRGNRYDTKSGHLSRVMPSVKGFGIKSFFYSASKLQYIITHICSKRMLKHIYGRNY